jgi:serine O-acetyltransferase
MQEKLNFRSMGAALVNSISACNKYKARHGFVAKVLWKYARLRHLFWSVITASEFDANAIIGERLTLPHPNGVIVHSNAIIGDDCLIMQQVTIGQLSDGHAPVIGSGVYIGAGAKILGRVAIGDRARIGANAVVLCDVPADCTAVGVPARLIPVKTVGT